MGMTCLWASAAAQAATPSLTIDVASDERRRGISWSDGKAVLHANGSLGLLDGVSIDIAATTLRGARRHGGAEAGLDGSIGYALQTGAWRLAADGGYHLFPGGDAGYAEIGGSADTTLGPIGFGLFARYAPKQNAIGGDNLYAGANLSAAIPGTALTASAHVGRSSGNVSNASRATRLRPEGRYWDHGVALDYYSGRWFAGLRYADSSIAPDSAAHAGASIVGRFGVSF